MHFQNAYCMMNSNDKRILVKKGRKGNQMKRKLAAIGMAFCLMTGTVSAMGIEAAAAEAATVTGTVRSGTTSDLLLLSTKEGNMEIKLDSGTDTSSCFRAVRSV